MTSKIPSPSTIQLLRPRYARFIGWQYGKPLYVLKQPIPGHTEGSSVVEATLDAGIANLNPISDLHPVTTPAQKVAEYAELRSHLE